MKKSLIIIILVLLTSSIVGCSSNESNTSETSNVQEESIISNNQLTENNNNNYYSQNIIDNSNETSFYENSSDVSKEKVYVHTAIEGAVIVEQDGSKEFSYQGHCEACGKTDTTMTKQTSASSGEITSAFLCPNCSNQQKIIIETKSYS